MREISVDQLATLIREETLEREDKIEIKGIINAHREGEPMNAGGFYEAAGTFYLTRTEKGKFTLATQRDGNMFPERGEHNYRFERETKKEIETERKHRDGKRASNRITIPTKNETYISIYPEEKGIWH